MQYKPVFDAVSTIDQTNYYYVENFFNEQEFTWFNNLKSLYAFEEASIVGNSTNIRKSNIKWIHPDDKSFWVYNKLGTIIQEANNALWNFDVHTILDSIQYTEYPHGNGHYDWHIDIGPHPINHRKISLVMQLSGPEEYEGGDLEIWPGGTPITIPKQKGLVVLFPSYLMHRVTPVTKGVRSSLVLWAGGNGFK
jgi:PKHD-type hydroxylase